VFIRNIEDPSQCEVYTEHSTAVQCAKYSPSGSYIASADSHGKVRIWGADNKEHLLKNEFQPFSGTIKDLAWTSDNQRIIVGGEGKEKFGHVFSWDAGNSVGEISGMTKAINSVDFKSTRPFRAITGSEDNGVSFFEGPPFKWKTTISEHEKFVHVVRYSPDGEKFASGAADGRVILYDGKTGERLSELGAPAAHAGSIYGLCWDSTSRFILTASGDKTAKIWDVTTGSAVQTYTFGNDLKDQQVGCLWSGTNILSVSLSGQITYLDREGQKPLRIIRGHNKSITALTVAHSESHGTRIFSASHDGLVVSWSVDGRQMDNITGNGHTNQVQSLASNSKGLVASIGLDDTLRLLNSSWESYDQMEKLNGQPRDIAISDSNIIFLVCGSSICMYKEQQGVLITHPLEFEPTSIAISPDGTQIAVGGKDNKTHIYSVDGTALTVLRVLEQRDAVTRVTYSPDGRFFASADNMKNIVCYQLPNYESISRDMWRYHAATITGLAFSPDGKKLASVAIDTHLMIYQPDNITKVTQVKGAHPLNPATCLAWLDNDTLITGGNDCCLRKWTVKC
jgi:WD40 repeat protein